MLGDLLHGHVVLAQVALSLKKRIASDLHSKETITTLGGFLPFAVHRNILLCRKHEFPKVMRLHIAPKAFVEFKIMDGNDLVHRDQILKLMV